MVILEVSFAGQVVAALLYFVQGPVAHGHVLACTDTGYRMGALYAGIWHSMEHFGGRTRWINLMGVPGLQDAAAEGIRRFKLGWTHTTRTAWLCGRIINRQRYADLVAARSMPPALQQSYFPAYRAGEAD